jgi:hypothetical protein
VKNAIGITPHVITAAVSKHRYPDFMLDAYDTASTYRDTAVTNGCDSLADWQALEAFL